MGTITEKLAALQDTKNAIRDALTEMGQEVYDDDPFSFYPELIRTMPSGGQLPAGVCTITVESANAAMGTVSPGGAVSSGMTVTIEAEPKAGYAFKQWNRFTGGSMFPTTVTTQSHTFTVAGDARYVAVFQAV